MRFDEHGKTLYPEPAGCYDSTMEQVAVEFLDTHEAVRRLTDAGMPEPQAEVVVRVQADTHRRHLATREQVEKLRAEVERLRLETGAQIENVRAEIDKLRLETTAEIDKLRLETTAQIENVRAEIDKLRLETRAEIAKVRAEIERVRAEIEAAKVSTIRWVAGLNLALVGLVITFLQFS